MTPAIRRWLHDKALNELCDAESEEADARKYEAEMRTAAERNPEAWEEEHRRAIGERVLAVALVGKLRGAFADLECLERASKADGHITTLPDAVRVWRSLLEQFELPEGRKAVAGEALEHLGLILGQLGLTAEGQRVTRLGFAFLTEVSEAPVR